MGKHTHARYTDAEAVTAAKTVKLDDFTAPDDNTDLDASTNKHGLFPKLDHDKLDGIAAGADVTGANPPQAHGAAQHTNITRTIWLPMNEGHTLAGTSASYGRWAHVNGAVGADEPEVTLDLKIPVDFVSFTSVKLVWMTNTTSKNMRWKMRANWCAAGEAFNAHAEDGAMGETAQGGTANIFNVQEPSDPLSLSGLAVGDFLGFGVYREGSHVFDTLDAIVYFTGLLFTYVANQ